MSQGLPQQHFRITKFHHICRHDLSIHNMVEKNIAWTPVFMRRDEVDDAGSGKQQGAQEKDALQAVNIDDPAGRQCRQGANGVAGAYQGPKLR